MYNLKRFNGTFKGNIGECMFKLTRRNLFLTRFHPRYKIVNYLSSFLNLEQKQFLEKNWYSVDAIELINNKIFLFEVKTRNRYKIPLRYKPKTTLSTIKIYSTAMELGFKVKNIFIWLEEDWNYSLEIKDFKSNDLSIDSPSKYDKK